MEFLHMLTGPLFPALLIGFRHCSSAFLALFTLAGFCLSGCAGVNVVMLSTETFTPQTSQVEILEREPNRPYVQIAVLTVDSLWLGVDSKREKILEKARTLGADAVIFGDLHLQRRHGGKQTDAQNPSSPSLPPEEIQKPTLPADDLLSFNQDQTVDGEVSAVLVRGGRGGGRGLGGPGGWRGRSWGPHYNRPWGGYYGPYYGPYYRPWGYGFRPGWWGYGPYWGGPYWGVPYGGGYYYDVPYPTFGAYSGYGYGYTNSVTVGTAIHYTN